MLCAAKAKRTTSTAKVKARVGRAEKLLVIGRIPFRRELAVGPSKHSHGARLPNAAGQFYIEIPLLKRFIVVLMMNIERTLLCSSIFGISWAGAEVNGRSGGFSTLF